MKSTKISDVNIATKDQLLQCNGMLYEQTDGVAMGSPLGPLMENAFMCSIEEKLEMEIKLPKFYRRYVDDVCAVMQGLSAVEASRDSLNNSHPLVNFTMEMEDNRRLSRVSIEGGCQCDFRSICFNFKGDAFIDGPH